MSLHNDVSRIACTAGIEPTIVSFAKDRTALHWGLPEEEVDVLVSVQLMRTSAELTGKLQP